MAPGARSKIGVPMLEPEGFRKQMHCVLKIKKVLVTLLELFGARVFMPPTALPSLRPWQGRTLSPLDFGILCFCINVIVEKCFSLTFE